MNIVGIAVFAATIAVAVGQGGPYCNPLKGLKYTDCVRCSNTCNNYWYDPYLVCFGCNPGCDCADKDKYIREGDGMCVYPDQCFDICECNSVATSDSQSDDYVPDNYCGPDQVYADQRPCYNTCQEYLNKGACGIRGAGCTCREPGYYIYEQNNVCVTATACEIFYSGDSAPANTDDSGEARCGVNERFTTCGGCEPTCQNPRPEACAAVCRVGCFCISGYLRNSNGVCVRPEECGNNCGPDQRYVNQLPCFNTCKDYLYTDACGIRGPGCTCAQQGLYILESNGLCVQPLICEIYYGGPAAPALTDDSGADYSCGPDQEYTNQLPCYNTCKEYLYDYACGIRGPGCTCTQDGYYIYEPNGVCVTATACEIFYSGNNAPDDGGSARCDVNEYFTNCGSCEPTCENPEPEACAAVCVVGCFCQDGYLRNSNGVCVRPEDCGTSPPLIVCDSLKGQTFYEVLPCYVTCQEYLSPSDVCIERGMGCACREEGYYILESIDFCVPAQVCQAYYSRPAASSCAAASDDSVSYDYGSYNDGSYNDGSYDDSSYDGGSYDDGSDYISNSCGQGQIYVEQIPCKNTCQDYNDGNDVCIERGPGCTCEQNGYYIREDTNECVAGNDCP